MLKTKILKLEEMRKAFRVMLLRIGIEEPDGPHVLFCRFPDHAVIILPPDDGMLKHGTPRYQSYSAGWCINPFSSSRSTALGEDVYLARRL